MRCITLLLAAALVTPVSAVAQGAGGFLFAYQPHPGSRAALYDGYRAHLEWHRAAGDSLTWYAWDVLAGPRIGAFVDGVFGVAFSALDHRVDPAGDAADLARNVTPHGEPVARALIRVRRELGTAAPLEEGEAPTLFAQVVRYTVPPSGVAAFEEALEALRREAREELLPYTVYETLAGARSSFVVVVWRSGLATFDAPERDPAGALRDHLPAVLPASGGDASYDIEEISEVWRYRADLTYFGTREEP